jgi:hypothetical protein
MAMAVTSALLLSVLLLLLCAVDKSRNTPKEQNLAYITLCNCKLTCPGRAAAAAASAAALVCS